MGSGVTKCNSLREPSEGVTAFLYNEDLCTQVPVRLKCLFSSICEFIGSCSSVKAPAAVCVVNNVMCLCPYLGDVAEDM